MSITFRNCLFTLALLLFFQTSYAQELTLTKEFKEQSIQKLAQLMNDFYILPEVAKATEAHLMAQWKKGHFDQFSAHQTFADALTKSVQSINKDKHMRIMVNPPFKAPENSPERKVEERVYEMNRSRSYNSGLNSVKILEGNVGYLDLRGFAGMENGKAIADSYMKLMAHTDAIIIDLSKNGGGSPYMVQYLCSYFFDQKLHLNSLYYRAGDRTEEYWTLDKVGGTKMPEIPLFVMTSSRTFSGAEEFSYNMQTQKRATLVGQTTGGGANPGGTRGINESLSVFIPTGMAINPITNTSWEGTGVVPEVKTAIDETMDQAHELAREAAKEYRAKAKERFANMYQDLYSKLELYESEKSDEIILQALTECQDGNLLDEWSINMLGYEYLMEHQKPTIAASIFKANTILHPNSGNVFDSYGEALLKIGNREDAIKNYKKSIQLDPNNENGMKVLADLGVDLEKPKEEDLFFLQTDSTWRKELFHFPIHFAPDIPYEGVEDARFPIGWEDKKSPNFWTYAFGWNVEIDDELTERELEENIQIYFDGLMEGVNKEKEFTVPSTVAQFIKQDDSHYIGKVKVHDSFHTRKTISLNIKVNTVDFPKQKKTIILFKFSPQDFNHSVWKNFEAIKIPKSATGS